MKCNCTCHTNSNIKHVFPCCVTCRYCKEEGLPRKSALEDNPHFNVCSKVTEEDRKIVTNYRDHMKKINDSFKQNIIPSDRDMDLMDFNLWLKQ